MACCPRPRQTRQPAAASGPPLKRPSRGVAGSARQTGGSSRLRAHAKFSPRFERRQRVGRGWCDGSAREPRDARLAGRTRPARMGDSDSDSDRLCRDSWALGRSGDGEDMAGLRCWCFRPAAGAGPAGEGGWQLVTGHASGMLRLSQPWSPPPDPRPITPPLPRSPLCTRVARRPSGGGAGGIFGRPRNREAVCERACVRACACV